MSARVEPAGQSGYRRGAMLLSLGIGLSGLLTYAYFALASHALGKNSYGALTVLWSVLFISVVTLYRPVEQFVSRDVATARAAGHDYGGAMRVAAAIQVGLAVAFLVLARRSGAR